MTLATILRSCWGFSIALDGGNSSNSSYLDVRVRVGIKGNVYNWHFAAIPMRGSQTGECMFNLISTLLDSLVYDCRKRLIGATNNGAPSMTGRYQGVVTRLQKVALAGFYRIWCAAHQLDLVVKRVFHRTCDESFVNILSVLSGYLRHKQNLVLEMKSKCPRCVDTRWISMKKVLTWLVANRIRIVAYLEEKEARCAAPDHWWVVVIVLNGFVPIVDRAFCRLQGKTLLFAPQTAILDERLLEILEVGDVDGPLSSSVIDAVEHPDCVRGRYTMSLRKACHFVDCCCVFAMERIQRMSDAQNGIFQEYVSVLHSITFMFVDTAHGVESITAARDTNDERFSEELRAVTPIMLQKTDRVVFSRLIMQQSERLLHTYSRKHVDELDEC
jgi:hypothetical protein